MLAGPYELIAISSHLGGSLHAGHYHTTLRSYEDSAFFCIDDQRMDQGRIPIDDIQSLLQEAYVLVYKKLQQVHDWLQRFRFLVSVHSINAGT